MPILGHLQPGVVAVVKPGTGRPIGYAFTVETQGGGQLQRWLLKEEPQNAIEIRPAPSTMSNWTLQQWKAYVDSEWDKATGSCIYVLAQADVYTWPVFPDASALPPASYPPSPDSAQIEHITGGALKVQQNGSEGLVYALGGLSDPTSVEYWMLPPSFTAAGGTSSTQVAATVALPTSPASPTNGTDATATPGIDAEFAQFIELVKSKWTSGSRFVITGCVNYRGTEVPEAA